MKISDDDILAALERHKGVRKRVSEELGIAVQNLRPRIDKLKARGIIVPESDFSTTVGKSTLYGADGSVRLQWVKDKPEGMTPEKVAAAIREAFIGIAPAPRIPAPKFTLADLLTVYPIGDAHVGMYAWKEESGEDYDLKIAERLHTSAMSHLVDLAPASEEALIIDVGDYEHYDNVRQETTKSGNRLDCDTRYHAMIRVSLRMMCACIDAALTKHKRVTVIVVPGNHNDMGCAWKCESLAMYYRKNPRVHILAKAGKFFYFEFGKVLIGATHGDNGKPEKLAGVMSVDEPEMWGRSRFRYWYTGHVHHKSQQECMGTVWETFRTLAPTDAWARGAGYRGGREMQAIIHHRNHGEYGRHTFNPSILEAA